MIVVLADALRVAGAPVLHLVRGGVATVGVERVVERGAPHREADHPLRHAAGRGDGVCSARNVGDYLARLEEIKPETDAFKRRQQAAAERTPVP